MKGTTHIHWLRGLLVLAVVVAAGVMVATAGAVGRPPDVQDAAGKAPQHVTIPASLSRMHYPGTSVPFNLVAIPASLSRMSVGSAPVAASKPVDPLAVSYLSGQGLSPREVESWTTGSCSHQVKAASCYGMFEKATTGFADDVKTPPDVQDTASFLYGTPAGQKADGLRWQRQVDAYKQLESSNGSTALGQQADGLRLQAMAQAYREQSNSGGNYPATYDVGGQQVQPTGQGTPDVFERYAAAHPFGQGLTQVSSTIVNRPPDVTDAALSVETASAGSSTGFEWSDWGIGIGTGLGIVLILGAGLIAGRGLRHRSIQTA